MLNNQRIPTSFQWSWAYRPKRWDSRHIGVGIDDYMAAGELKDCETYIWALHVVVLFCISTMIHLWFIYDSSIIHHYLILFDCIIPNIYIYISTIIPWHSCYSLVISLIVQLFIPFLCRSVSPAVSAISRFLPLAIKSEVNHGKPLLLPHFLENLIEFVIDQVVIPWIPLHIPYLPWPLVSQDGGTMIATIYEEIERPDHGSSKAAKLRQQDERRRWWHAVVAWWWRGFSRSAGQNAGNLKAGDCSCSWFLVAWKIGLLKRKDEERHGDIDMFFFIGLHLGFLC